MPRFFAQVHQQALADRRKAAFAVPETAAMKAAQTREGQLPAAAATALPHGIQGAIAQMESNAAAAVARFRSFRTSGQLKEGLETAPSEGPLADEAVPESPGAVSRSQSAPAPDASAEHRQASRLAALEAAAARYLAADADGTPWHHHLRGTQWAWLGELLDRPAALLAAAAALLAAGCWQQLLAAARACFTVQRMSLVAGVACLLLAASGWLLRTAAFAWRQAAAFADTVPRMPGACQEMTAMLHEMRLMRHDLKSMKAKVAWLPGGE